MKLSPSEQEKNGPFFDLAMAIGVLKETGELKEKIPKYTVFMVALSLDGSVDKVEGILLALIAAKGNSMFCLGMNRIFILRTNFNVLPEEVSLFKHMKGIAQSDSFQERSQPLGPILKKNDFNSCFVKRGDGSRVSVD